MDHPLFNLAVRKVSSRTEKKKHSRSRTKCHLWESKELNSDSSSSSILQENHLQCMPSQLMEGTQPSVTYSMVLKSLSPPTKGRSGAEVLGARYLWFCLQDALGNPWYLMHSTMGNFCAIETLRPDLRVFWHCHKEGEDHLRVPG